MSTLTAHLARRRLAAVAAAAAAALLATASPAAAQGRAPASRLGAARAVSGGAWGTAIEVPGTAALNTVGFGGTRAVSCASAGNCSAGGAYADSSGTQVFVVSQVNGRWGTAKEVPGLAALNTGGGADLYWLSCATAGNCSAGGYYTDSSPHPQAFVVSQVHGRWGTAKEVPGLAALNTGGNAQVDSVSCATAGNCSAGGFYTGSSGHGRAFVVSQVNGRWGTAKEVPGTAALGPGGAGITSLSCASAGNCSAGGGYTDSSGHAQAFVVSQVNGRWGTATEVPGIAALNTGGLAGIDPIECTFTCDPAAGLLSCASAGNCSAGGFYADNTGRLQAFVVSQVNGRWGTAKEVAANLNTGAHAGAGILSVSCPSAGNCSAGGAADLGAGQAFVVSQVNGRWGTAKEVAGALNTGGNAGIISLSCASAGNCSAGGNYTVSTRTHLAFAVSQVNGTWGTATEVPGTATLNTGGDAQIDSLSCATAGNCSAGGYYIDSTGHGQSFVDSQT
jgi:hypothetical protein